MYLASALAENSSLEELKLVNCNISNKGAQILARQLRKMGGLKSLWLQENPFGVRGARSLYRATLQNWQLEQLWLPTGKGEAVDQLQEALIPHLQLNQAGQKLLTMVDQNKVPPGVWALAMARIKGVTFDSVSSRYPAEHAPYNAMYKLLQGPALWYQKPCV